ncbi:MAG: hypothetical protein JWN83_2515 [Chitinophagaceae bacterium]|nr:hypothetical protein [Chitinophagaceae bacterium]
MIEKVIMIIALIGIFIIGRYARQKYMETKKGLLIFFLIFLTLIIAFTIDLIDHFSYTRFLVLTIIIMLGAFDYYKRFQKLKHG